MIKYIRDKDTISGRLQDEIVMMDVYKGKYYALSPVATSIWEILDKPSNLDQICEALQNEYDVNPEQCKAETEECIKKMLKLNLIKKVVS